MPGDRRARRRPRVRARTTRSGTRGPGSTRPSDVLRPRRRSSGRRSGSAPYELEEIGDVTGSTLLHLQCHFGIDTLSWARLGARVTGADFSQAAIELATRDRGRDRAPRTRASSGPTCTTCRASSRATSTSSTRRAACSAGCPTSGAGPRSSPTSSGPAAASTSPRSTRSRNVVRERGRRARRAAARLPVLGAPRRRWPSTVNGSYADPDAPTSATPTEYGWDHGLGEIVTALIEAGLRIESLGEHPFLDWKLDFLVEEDAEGDVPACRRARRASCR